MTDIRPLIPRQTVPSLSVALASGGTFDLAKQTPKTFTMVVAYRGLHCPICKTQLKELEAKLGEFEIRGVAVVAISSDTRERAEKAKAEWGLARLPVGYGLGLDSARAWGLFLSQGRGPTSAGVEEPALFSEPGLFLVRPDRTLYCASVQTMPFARPHFDDILSAIDFVVAKNYPARGEIVNLEAAAAA